MTDGQTAALLMVRTNVEPGAEGSFNKWYTDVHLPEIVGVPGVHWGKRFRVLRDDASYPSDDSVPTYLAIYGLEHAEVLRSEEFLASRGWSDEIKPHVRDTVVAVYEHVASVSDAATEA
jgi:hypothetical protein